MMLMMMMMMMMTVEVVAIIGVGAGIHDDEQGEIGEGQGEDDRSDGQSWSSGACQPFLRGVGEEEGARTSIMRVRIMRAGRPSRGAMSWLTFLA
eukprot:8262754-Pyramimonas_sp.AAC.1